MSSSSSAFASEQPLAGVLFGASAFLIWGLSPLYWKLLAVIPSSEIVLHRIVWSFLFLVLLLFCQRRWQEFFSSLASKKIVLRLTLSTLCVATNWFCYIWAVSHNYVLQASLGYYINPLVSVFLGMIFLRERLRRLQAIAVLLAAIGVTYLTLHIGQIPWVSLALAFSFGFYGLIRKTTQVGSLVGLAIETLLLSLPAAAYLFHLQSIGQGAFLHTRPSIDFLLIGTSVITALPLLFFALGARRLHLRTVGFLQYIAPSCMFLLAVFVFKEPIIKAQVQTFIFIWLALGLYSADSYLAYKSSL